MTPDEDLEFPKPGVWRRDLKPCEACGKPLMKQEPGPGLPLPLKTLQAYRVTLDMLMLDVRALQQYGGVMAILGGDTPFADNVANALAPDTELLKCLDSTEAVICQPCYFHHPPVELAEAIRNRRATERRG